MTIKLPTLKEYIQGIESLPLKEKYTKEELLIPELLVEKQGTIELYYTAHNEYFNPKAKVFMVGITPGFSQMQESILACKKALQRGEKLEDIPYICKKAGRFSGVLRKNIAEMLDELDLSTYLGLETTKALFEASDSMLHTTSLIPFPTFVKGKNYTGHSPELIKNVWLMKYVRANMDQQIDLFKDVLYIPMGKCVEEVLKIYIGEDKLKESQCLLGFPHPSGANVNRKNQFNEEKAQMMFKIKAFYQ